MITKLLYSILLVALLLTTSPLPVRADQPPTPIVDNGKTVSIEYTLTLDDGQTVDTNVGGKPFVYEQGKAQILPALEQALQGLAVDARKSVTLSPEEGYGVVDRKAFQPVPLEQLPTDARKVGEQLVIQGPDQQTFPARVHQIQDNIAVLDLNHPLAGQTLHFDIRILNVK